MLLNANEKSGLTGLIGGFLIAAMVMCDNNAPVPGTPENHANPIMAGIISAASIGVLTRVGIALFDQNSNTVTDNDNDNGKNIHIGRNELFVGNQKSKENTGEGWLEKNKWVGPNDPNRPEFF
jgi:hypothetical protein